VGYDTRDNDYRDGYSFVNADRFYWLWDEAFYFDTLTWRTLITAVLKRQHSGGAAQFRKK